MSDSLSKVVNVADSPVNATTTAQAPPTPNEKLLEKLIGSFGDQVSMLYPIELSYFCYLDCVPTRTCTEL